MSILGALQSGVSGLAAQSSAMSAISDNISNMNTIGYKDNNVSFSTLVTKQAISSYYSSGGVQSTTKQGINLQGLLTSVSSATSVGISGSGFFVVNGAEDGTGTWAYTRAGDFDIDNTGYLQNSAGFYVQAWTLLPWDGTQGVSTVEINDITYMKAYTNSAGQTVYINDNIVDSTNLRGINLSNIGGTATPTTQIKYGANLPSGDEVGNKESVSVLMYDSLGNPANMSLTYTKTSSNSWSMGTSIPSGASDISLYTEDGKLYSAVGQLEFTGIPKDGETITINDGVADFTFEFDSDGNTTAGNVAIDTTSLTSTLELLNALKTAIDASGIAGEERFYVNGASLNIEQSATGNALQFECIGAPSCIQSASDLNLNSGIASGKFNVNKLTSGDSTAIVFNADGTPKIINIKEMAINWANGAEDMSGDTGEGVRVALFMGNTGTTTGLTHLSGKFATNYVTQDGATFGSYSGVNIDKTGIVTAIFDNGETKPIAIIPLAMFTNCNGMEAMNGNVWVETTESGQAMLTRAKSGGSGEIVSSSVEASTVDLASQFSSMIVTQRAYSASGKIITTADEMLDELTRLV